MAVKVFFIKFKVKEISQNLVSDGDAGAPLKAAAASQVSPPEGAGWNEKVESQRAFCVTTLPGLSSATNTSPICGPLTVGAMYRTSWALFKIGAQLPLQVQSLNISHFP